MRACDGWPDQPCAWDRCLSADACQNPAGPSGTPDVAITPGGVLVAVEGARIVSAEDDDE